MSNSTNGKFLRGIMLSSPVLVIAAVSIIFSVSVALEGKIDSSPTGSTSNNTQQVDIMNLLIILHLASRLLYW